ncbi:TIGR03621 family F420-dependent LLM class oxidoreductase [Actinoplanes sp. NPDC049596]|uniref:TIGR03621 family F420-dependent LLM class oxidoreductase n=1 Tax=unclassified Actinoplanes TaxID=2626549 RepID=UPI003427BB7E
MTTAPFRFGVSLLKLTSRSEWRARVRQAEDMGYDVLHVPDHLETPSPLVALVAAADATSMRLGTFVMNAGIVNPKYLARDVADVYRLTEGRLELGLGAGYVPAEFEAVGLPFGTGGERLQKLEAVLSTTRQLLAEEPDKPQPRIMLAGAGDRMLRLGARAADIFSFNIRAGLTEGMTPDQAFAHRIEILREAAGDRFADLELNLGAAAVAESLDDLDLEVIGKASGLDDTQLGQLPAVLVGSPREIADRLQRYREQHDVSYISVLEPHMNFFARVIKHLR